MLELIINKETDKKSIMLVDNGILLEKHEEHENHQRLEGNIYCGVVQNIFPGMQSAFVDIGDTRNTFIRLKDLLPKEDETKSDINNKINEYRIQDVIKTGMKLLVQVKRDGTENKGARVSTHINLPGRFCVFMPNSNFITVSQKIEDQDERNRLINIAKEILPQGTGAIIRTSGENIEEEVLIKELENLIKKWNDIEIKCKKETSNFPKIVYDNKALLRRTLIDIIDQNLNRVIVNDKKTYNDIFNILNDTDINANNIELILKENEDLLEMYELRNQLEKTDNRKIWLKCGGFITIDRTEALTAIDVNTGKYTGTKNLEETVFKVNKEATIEIAKQLRLRDIGGIIIIDYIDMHEEKNRKEIIELFKTNLRKDRTKSQILGFTKLNLLEMTRKNMCNNDDY